MIEPPLPFGSAAGRWYYVLLKGLVERGHQVKAFATCSKAEELAAARKLFPSPRYDLQLFPFPTRRSFVEKFETVRKPSSYMFNSEFKRAFREALEIPHDVVHLEQLWSGWLALNHRMRSVLSIHFLLEIDLKGAKAKSPDEWKNRRLESMAERRLLRRFRHFRACTARIGDAIQMRNREAKVTVVPFGFDVLRYPYRPDSWLPAAPVVTLIGMMSWTPNRTAAERLLVRLWPEIKRRVPDAKLRIVGWGARSALAALGFETLADVDVLEDVPDAGPYFEESCVLLYAPEHSSGMKTKIQEAMAYGVPVVTTSEGVEGLLARDGVHAGICDHDAGLIDRAVAMLTDTASRNRQRANARRLIEEVCDPDATVISTLAIYETIVRQNV